MKPIPFNSDMINAILENRKTQTRRIVKLPRCGHFEHEPPRINEPYKVGDILYVRETWRVHKHYKKMRPKWVMAAMGGDVWGCIDYKASPRTEDFWGGWRPSIHMPKEAARIFLRVTSVKAQRLQDITENDAKAEGFNSIDIDECEEYEFTAVDDFALGWSDIYWKDKSRCWEANPWVWVIEFERMVDNEPFL